MRYEDAISYNELVMIVREDRQRIADLCARVRELEQVHVGIVARGECPSDDGPDPFERLTSED